jgi:hypothetical protein
VAEAGRRYQEALCPLTAANGPDRSQQGQGAAYAEGLLAVRDAIANDRSDGAAVGFVRAVSALLQSGLRRGWVEYNAIHGGTEGLHKGELRAWTEAEASLAIHTGQRRGDLIKLTCSQYDGTRSG